jgi:hypothetical protein
MHKPFRNILSVLAVVLALAGSGFAVEQGSARASAIGWNAPPDGQKRIPPNGVVTLPRCATEVDVWIKRSAHADRPSVRLSQWTVRGHGSAFGLRRADPFVGYVSVNRDAVNLTERRNLVVYWWCS